MSLVLGVDGGATKTTCVAFSCDSHTLLGKATSGSANWNSVGADSARAELWKAIRSCLKECNKTENDLAGICVGMAGVDTPEDVTRVTDELKGELPEGVLVAVHNDAVTALASGTGGVLEGCVLVAGTGTVALGLMDGGRVQARAAGWGPVFMDGGSGYDLGHRALSAVSKCHDGRGAPTLLLEGILDHLQMDNPEELIRWAYTNPGWAHVASLAPVVIDRATAGDPVADTILKHGVGELFRSVKAVVSKLHLDRQGGAFKLVLAGGLLKVGTLYTQYLVEVLKAEYPRAEVTYPRMDPAEGAALLAFRQVQEAGALTGSTCE